MFLGTALLLLVTPQAQDTLLVQALQRGVTASMQASPIGTASPQRAIVVDTLSFERALGHEVTASLNPAAIGERASLGSREAVVRCSPTCAMPDKTVLVEVTTATVGTNSVEATVQLTWSLPLYRNGALFSSATESNTSTVVLAREGNGWVVQEVRPRRPER